MASYTGRDKLDSSTLLSSKSAIRVVEVNKIKIAKAAVKENLSLIIRIIYLRICILLDIESLKMNQLNIKLIQSLLGNYLASK